MNKSYIFLKDCSKILILSPNSVSVRSMFCGISLFQISVTDDFIESKICFCFAFELFKNHAKIQGVRSKQSTDIEIHACLPARPLQISDGAVFPY